MGELIDPADQEIPPGAAGEGVPAPKLAVVIPALRGYSAIRTTVGHLEAQSWRDHLELVIVTPTGRALDLKEAELSWCRHLRVVEVGEMTSLGASYAAGVLAASAPVVALAEDHSFPEPDWARALIERHREPWAAVGPVVESANPGSPFGDATYYMGYGQWAGLTTPGEIDDLPGHNSAYKRAVLLDYGRELGALLEAESILHWDLRAKGHRLCLEPAARTYHHNPVTLSFLVEQSYHYGRLFAAARARGWSWTRRALYTGASIVIPLVRLRRIVAQIRRAGSGRRLPKLLPALIVGLVTSAGGELVGYARGAGRAPSRLFALECTRDMPRVEATSPPPRANP